ncbi:MAG: hypothetical protein ACRC1V_12925 [Plesiomonas sp.]
MKNHLFLKNAHRLPSGFVEENSVFARLLYAPVVGQPSAICNLATSQVLNGSFITINFTDPVHVSWSVGDRLALVGIGNVPIGKTRLLGQWIIVSIAANSIAVRPVSAFGSFESNCGDAGSNWAIGASGAAVINLSVDEAINLPNSGPPVEVQFDVLSSSVGVFQSVNFPAPAAGVVVGVLISTGPAGKACAFIDTVSRYFSANPIDAAASGRLFFTKQTDGSDLIFFDREGVAHPGPAINNQLDVTSIQYQVATGDAFHCASPNFPKVIAGDSDYVLRLENLTISLSSS